MAQIDLLQTCRDAGLEVFTDGDELVIRGPRSEEHLAKELLEKKTEVMAELLAKQMGDALGYDFEVVDMRREGDPPADLHRCSKTNWCPVPPPGSLTSEERDLLRFIKEQGRDGTAWSSAEFAGLNSEGHRLGWGNLAARGLIRARKVRGKRHKVIATARDDRD